MSQRAFILVAIFISIVLGMGFFVLPSLGGEVFLSPDETANAVAGNMLLKKGDVAIPRDFSLISQFSWLHPRSFVNQLLDNGRMAVTVPVAFLGMPFLSALLQGFEGTWGLAVFTPLLAISVVYPLWRLTRPFGRVGQIAAIVGWLTFPTVILYANRGLFPNLVVVCFVVWAMWLMVSTVKIWKYVAAGAFLGLAFMIRPIEFVWIGPLTLALLSFRVKHSGLEESLFRKVIVYLLIPFFLLCFLLLYLNSQTYDSPFVFGYQLRDPMFLPQNDAIAPMMAEPVASKPWYQSWPFGFHPRNMWFNARSYLIIYLFPWFASALAASILIWKEKEKRKWIVVSALVIGILVLLYGQGLYQDHVRTNHVALGNSFLRYLLPISVIASLSLAIISNWIVERRKRGGVFIAGALIIGIAAFGLWTAFFRDDEGLWKNRQELRRYAAIREQAKTLLASSDHLGSTDDYVVLSERSDKIFFPEFLAVSPLPSRSEIRRLMSSEVVRRGGVIEERPVLLFIRTVSPSERQAWEKDGIGLELIFEAGNESLYRAVVIPPSQS